MKKINKLLPIIAIISLSACTTVSKHSEEDIAKIKFNETNYQSMFYPVIDSVTKNKIPTAISKNNDIGDISVLSSLNSLESGRLDQLNNDYKKSIIEYDKALSSIPKTNEEAKKQAKASLLSKDTYSYYDINAPYDIPDYAIVYLYTYQALNYLSTGNITKAQNSLDNLGVAGIWIDKQKMLVGGMKDLTKKYIKQDKIRLENLGINDIESIKKMSRYSREIPDAFGSPVAYYLKSVLELSKKDYTASLDSLHKAHEYTTGNSYLDSSIEEAYIAKQTKKPFYMGMGRVVVIYEQGLINMRDQIKAPLKLGKIGKINFDFPVYSTKYPFLGPKSISISQNGKELTNTYTETLYDSTLFAMKSLTESYATIIVQDVVIEVLKHNYDKGFALGGMLGSHLKINLSKTEPKRADMRSWLLLPNSVDLFEKQIDSGKYSININNIRQNIEVKQGKTTLLWIVNIGEYKKVNYFII